MTRNEMTLAEAWRAGAAAMREKAAQVADKRCAMWMNHGGASAMVRENEAHACATAIRATDLPEPPR